MDMTVGQYYYLILDTATLQLVKSSVQVVMPVRMSELSRRTGVPVPTIKYYLREGLLPPGEATGATQAIYDESHARRLLLVRALAEVGELSLSAVRDILRAVDDGTTGVHELLGIAQYALGPTPSDDERADPAFEATRAEVDRFLSGQGWHVTAEAPGRAQLAHALHTLRRLGFHRGMGDLQPYADAAADIAAHEVGLLSDDVPRAEAVQRAVVMTVLYEPILLAFRRLAQEHESAKRFGEPGEA